MLRIAGALLVSRTQDVQQEEDEDEDEEKAKSGGEVHLVHADTRERRREEDSLYMRLYGGALAWHRTGNSGSRLHLLPVCPVHRVGCQSTHTHKRHDPHPAQAVLD